MLLAFVAGRRTPTTVALAAAAPHWVDTRIFTPEEAATVLGTGDVAVGRIDVAGTLDGVEDGLWALGTLAARGVRVLNRAGALLAAHDKLLTARVLQRDGLRHLLEQVHQHNRFYQSKLDGIEFDAMTGDLSLLSTYLSSRTEQFAVLMGNAGLLAEGVRFPRRGAVDADRRTPPGGAPGSGQGAGADGRRERRVVDVAR